MAGFLAPCTLHVGISRQIKKAVPSRIQHFSCKRPLLFAFCNQARGAGYIETEAIHAPPVVDEILKYSRPYIKSFFPSCHEEEWQLIPLDGGNINYLFHLKHKDHSILVKHARPYVKTRGPNFGLSDKRQLVEFRALKQLENRGVPCIAHALGIRTEEPKLLFMDFYPSPYVKVIEGLQNGIMYPNLGEHISNVLCTRLSQSDMTATDTGGQSSLVDLFENQDVMNANKAVIFTMPWEQKFDFGADGNHWTSPQLDHVVSEIRSCKEYQAAIASLLFVYENSHEVLIHNDFHFGNILATINDTVVIDWEFARCGPQSYDLGTIFCNALLAFFALDSGEDQTSMHKGLHSSSLDRHIRERQRTWCLEVIKTIWTRYSEHQMLSTAPLASNLGGGLSSVEHTTHIFYESLGFAGCCMFRMIVGTYHFPLLESIVDVDLKSKCELRCLIMARKLLTWYGGAGTTTVGMDDVLAQAALLYNT